MVSPVPWLLLSTHLQHRLLLPSPSSPTRVPPSLQPSLAPFPSMPPPPRHLRLCNPLTPPLIPSPSPPTSHPPTPHSTPPPFRALLRPVTRGRGCPSLRHPPPGAAAPLALLLQLAQPRGEPGALPFCGFGSWGPSCGFGLCHTVPVTPLERIAAQCTAVLLHCCCTHGTAVHAVHAACTPRAGCKEGGQGGGGVERPAPHAHTPVRAARLPS